MLRRNADAARAVLSPDAELVANAEAFLRAANAEGQFDRPASNGTPVVEREEPIVEQQRELVEVGD